MSTLRISNIEAKADNSSPTVDEQLKITNSSGDLMLYLDGRTSGITTVGINTTNQTIKFDENNNVFITGIVTATQLHGSVTFGFGDDEKALFGTSSDLEIYHGSGHSRIVNNLNSGALKLQSNQIEMVNKANSETLAQFFDGGACSLRFNNNTKFATTNTGVVVTGICTATSFVGDGSALTNLPSSPVGGASSISFNDNTKLYFGSTEDYEMFWNGNRMSFQPVSSSTTAELEIVSNDQLYICSKDQGLFLKSGDQNVMDLYGGGGGGIYFKHNNTQKLKLEGGNWTYLNSATVTHAADVFIPDKIAHVGDTNTAIRFPEDDNFTVECAGNERFRVKPTNDVAVFTGSNSGTLTIRNDTSNEMQLHTGGSDALILGTGGENERLRITSSGRLGIGDNNPSVIVSIKDTAPKIKFIDSDATGTPETLVDASGGDLILDVDKDNEKGSTLFAVKVDGSEKLRIDDSGRIGTNGVTISNANAGFDDLVITSSGGGNTGVTLFGSTSSQGTIAFADGSSGTAPFSGYLQYSHNGNTLMLGTNGGDKIRIGASGEIGVAGAGSLNNGSVGQVLRSGGNSAGCMWVDQGISDVDLWHLTSGFSGGADPITSNLSRFSGHNFHPLGSAMSVSSGVFTFPKTGVWLVEFNRETFLNGDDREVRSFIQCTDDNSGFTSRTENANHISRSESQNTHNQTYTMFVFDVENTSTHKVRFKVTTNNSSTNTIGTANVARTWFKFTRLGDT